MPDYKPHNDTRAAEIVRLSQFIEAKGYSTTAFAHEIGIAQRTLSSVLQAGKTLSSKIMAAILARFPELNYVWLLTGEGSMTNADTPAQNADTPTQNADTARQTSRRAPRLNKTISEVTPVPTENYMMAEYVDLRAAAGRLGGMCPEQLPEKHTRLLPKEFDQGNYLVIRVDGDSMNDGTVRALSDGDELLVKELTNFRWEELPIRKALFVITSSEGNMVKKIKSVNTEEGYITCQSFNKMYKDFTIDMRDIYQLFIVRKFVQKQIIVDDLA